MEKFNWFKKQYIFILLFIGFIILYSIDFYKKSEEADINFYKSYIKGILTKLDSNVGGIYITIDNETEYNFNETVKENFPYIAEEGDSIIKPAFNDSITLKKPNGEVYKFTFRKPK